MATFNKTVTSLAEAKEIIEVYFKMMPLEDRREWWEDTVEHPYQKLYELVKELMLGYSIQYYVDHQESDEDLIPSVLELVEQDVKGKIVEDFQFEDFWFEEVGHERLYFTAIKTK